MKTLRHLNGQEIALLFSPGDSLASLSVVPGNEKAKKITVTSGLRCLELYRKPDPVGLLAKMLVGSSIWDSTIVFLTWKLKVTKCKRLLFQLVPSMPRTEEIGSGLLATPQASDPVEGARTAVKSQQVCIGRELNRIAMLPTPTGQEVEHPEVELTETGRRKTKNGKNSHSLGLADKIAMLPTPIVGDWKTGLKLQPAFVEWMMGFPIGWKDLNA